MTAISAEALAPLTQAARTVHAIASKALGPLPRAALTTTATVSKALGPLAVAEQDISLARLAR